MNRFLCYAPALLPPPLFRVNRNVKSMALFRLRSASAGLKMLLSPALASSSPAVALSCRALASSSPALLAERRTGRRRDSDSLVHQSAAPPPKKSPWQPVETPQGVYYWNKLTGDTTEIGAPPPGPNDVMVNRNLHQPTVFDPPANQQQPVSFVGQMTHMFGLGVGLTMGMVMIRVLMGG